MSGGPRAVAKACADILFRSDADTTSDKWSSKKTSVACGMGENITQWIQMDSKESAYPISSW